MSRKGYTVLKKIAGNYLTYKDKGSNLFLDIDISQGRRLLQSIIGHFLYLNLCCYNMKSLDVPRETVAESLRVRSAFRLFFYTAATTRKEELMNKKSNTTIDQLIPVTSQQIGIQKVQSVDARTVYEFLDVKQEFANWVKSRIKKYDFSEGTDYIRLTNVSSEHRIEYRLTISMAKHLCMVQNNPKGKQVRDYFIKCEDTLKKLYKRQANIEWKIARTQSILPQLEKSDTIKIFAEYVEAQGSTHAKTYYMNIQKMEYNALFEGGYKHIKFLSLAFPNLKTLKDLLNTKQLFIVANADMIVEKVLKEGMGKGMGYKDIFKLAKERITIFAAVIGQTPILPAESMLPEPIQITGT